MGKKLSKKSNFRVVIHPRSLGNLGLMIVPDSMISSNAELEYEKLCNEISNQVRRHIDGVGFVEVDFDREYVCEHCGYKWTEDGDKYNGGCCDKDEDSKNI